jgi:hypothetical protein
MTIHIGLVAGFGRCGTSLVMGMLAAGGLPIVGADPIFEDMRFQPGLSDLRFLRHQGGKIIKWVDATSTIVPGEVSGPVLWLDREPTEQAKSQIKMANAFGEAWQVDREMIAEVADQLTSRRGRAWALAAEVGPVSMLSFEALLFDPFGSASILQQVFRPFGLLDIQTAAAIVRSRAPQCSPMMEVTTREAVSSLFRSRSHDG